MNQLTSLDWISWELWQCARGEEVPYDSQLVWVTGKLVGCPVTSGLFLKFQLIWVGKQLGRLRTRDCTVVLISTIRGVDVTQLFKEPFDTVAQIARINDFSGVISTACVRQCGEVRTSTDHSSSFWYSLHPRDQPSHARKSWNHPWTRIVDSIDSSHRRK